MAKSRKGPPRLSEPAPNVRRVVRRAPNEPVVNTGPKPQANPIKAMALGGLVLVALVVFFLAPIGGKTPFSHLLSVFSGTPAAQPDAGAPASVAPPG